MVTVVIAETVEIVVTAMVVVHVSMLAVYLHVLGLMTWMICLADMEGNVDNVAEMVEIEFTVGSCL